MSKIDELTIIPHNVMPCHCHNCGGCVSLNKPFQRAVYYPGLEQCKCPEEEFLKARTRYLATRKLTNYMQRLHQPLERAGAPGSFDGQSK